MDVGPSNKVIDDVCVSLEPIMKNSSSKFLNKVIESLSGPNKNYEAATEFLRKAAEKQGNNEKAMYLFNLATYIEINKNNVPSSYNEGALKRYHEWLKENSPSSHSVDANTFFRDMPY